MIGAKIISRQIAATFSEGYAWCVETIKNSVYAGLAIELEMNKAVDMLKQGDLDGATEALTAFNNKDSKVSSAAANNLAMINLMVRHNSKSKYHPLPRLFREEETNWMRPPNSPSKLSL